MLFQSVPMGLQTVLTVLWHLPHFRNLCQLIWMYSKCQNSVLHVVLEMLPDLVTKILVLPRFSTTSYSAAAMIGLPWQSDQLILASYSTLWPFYRAPILSPYVVCCCFVYVNMSLWGIFLFFCHLCHLLGGHNCARASIHPLCNIQNSFWDLLPDLIRKYQ